MAETPYAIPLPQLSEPPLNVTLEAMDGTTLRVGFSPPASTGGEEVDRYEITRTDDDGDADGNDAYSLQHRREHGLMRLRIVMLLGVQAGIESNIRSLPSLTKFRR